MMNKLIHFACLAVFLAVTYSVLGITIDDAWFALDSPTGVEVVGFSYSKPQVKNGAIVHDRYGDILWEVAPSVTWSTDKWSVQYGTEHHTMPQSGGTCLRSISGMDDYGRCAVIFKVLGPGEFGVRTKTAAASGDWMTIYVDGRYQAMVNGYEWNYEPGTDDWKEKIVSIPRGKAQDGMFKDTNYHEIRIEFEKDGRPVEDDGPYKPKRGDYDDYSDYKRAYDLYLKEMDYFEDCVWIDACFIPQYDTDMSVKEYKTCWSPLQIDLTVNSGYDLEFTDSLPVAIFTNAYMFDCQVRYTLDGTEPTIWSPEITEDDIITLTRTCTFTAKVFMDDEPYQPEVMARQTFTKLVPQPVITLNKTASDGSHFVYSITCNDPTATIYYTINNGAEQTYSQPVTISAVATLVAYARTDDGTESIRTDVSVQQAQAPVVKAENKDGAYQSGVLVDMDKLVTVSATVKSGTVMVRQDNGNWVKYSGAIKCRKNTVFQFKTVVNGMLDSSVVELTVRYADQVIVFNGHQMPALAVGWNCISFPYELTLSSQLAFLQKFPVFKLSPGRGVSRLAVAENATALNDAVRLEPGQGYFIYIQDSRMLDDVSTAELYGAATDERPSLPSGWAFIGPCQGVTSDRYHIWMYAHGRFLPADGMETGRAYLVKRK